ncbi:uncharacterized protein LOC103703745 [Phoenix dactylifera]|uniref:Uncharacterized protein LOC103703745 n=1 Tax=Phoenix dactylifera TaxID=42345 RepID=A0A8B7BTD8_PHODC|nr:uncharacterized protein LOC103703745 [Phoenix dactylifera]XP_008784927.1 uncharacterized protein LOC103703745 [Phoenix dactylifera]
MPTFTAIALDRLLEPGASRNPTMRPPLAPGKVEKAPPSPSEKKSIPRPNVSPALYATPETTPLPDSPSSFPPSPYIINHKRRGPRLLKSFSQNDVAGSQPLPPPEVEKKIAMVNGKGVEETANGFHDEKLKGEQKDVDGNGTRGESVSIELHQGKLQDDGSIAAKEVARPVAVDLEKDGESEDFFDLQDSLSTTSNTELDERWKPSTPLGEYFDAFEEISSEGASQSACLNVEDELHEMRLNLLSEIERRKQAEETLKSLQNQWQMLSHHLSLVGLRLPDPPSMTEEKDEQSCADPAEELCQQIVIARFVAACLGRGCSRAEVEQLEPQIEAKNFEIARLCDRLHYYEAANREMSQRNQEAIEMARQQRHRRKKRQKWIWGSIGLAVSLGAAAIAWSYFPVSKPSPPEGNTIDSHEH